MKLTTVIVCLMVGVAMAAPKRTKESSEYCGGKPAEVFFLLDSSSSIWSVDFKKQLVFVNNVIDLFDVAPTRTRVGVASFSYRYHENIALDTFDNKEDLMEAVKEIRQVNGGTYTYDALDGVRSRGLNLNLVRPDVVRIAIVITDGKSYDERRTKEAARKLKESGVVVFALGIGSKTDKTELETIASEPSEEYLFEVGNYGLLDGIKEKLALKACIENIIKDEPDDSPSCGATNPADVMFLVDPAEIGANHMSTVFEFISDVTEDFNTEKGNIQIGLESRNCGSNNINLGQYADKQEMTKAFRNTNIPGMSHMVKRLRTHAYSEENGGRKSARKMAVIFVDDKLYNAKDVLNEARRTKMQDVELFVVAIGDSVVDDELMTLCSSSVDRHLLRVPSYENLKELKPEFLKKFCHGL